MITLKRKIYLCEDEVAIRSHLEKYIQNHIATKEYALEIACSSASPHELLATFQPHSRGIYFLDIDLKDAEYNGLTLAHAIRQQDPHGDIIFNTIHSELTHETFRLHLNVMDYIIKEQGRMDARIAECLDLIVQKSQTEQTGEMVFSYSTNGTQHHIPHQKIIYFQRGGRRSITLHTKEAIIQFAGELRAIAETLTEDFVFINRKTLINLKNIAHIYLSSNELELSTGERISFDNQRKPELIRFLQNRGY